MNKALKLRRGALSPLILKPMAQQNLHKHFEKLIIAIRKISTSLSQIKCTLSN